MTTEIILSPARAGLGPDLCTDTEGRTAHVGILHRSNQQRPYPQGLPEMRRDALPSGATNTESASSLPGSITAMAQAQFQAGGGAALATCVIAKPGETNAHQEPVSLLDCQ
jgi:hypothetical protein